MANGLRWTPEQYAAAAARAGAPARSVAAILVPHANGKIPRAEIRMLPERAPMPGVDIDRVHRKYRNEPTETEHGKFDSAKEAKRYAELVMLERAGRIANLRRQVPYALVVNGIHVCSYIADVVYREGARVVVEDVKSEATRRLPVYRIKVKLMQACHGLQVVER